MNARKNGPAILVRMPVELQAAVAAEASQHDRTQAQTIRRAIRLYLALPESKRR